MSEAENQTLAEDWAKVKLLPLRTGLPMAVWITQRDGYPHDVRIKVGTLHGGRGAWPDAVSIALRPVLRVIPPGQLSPGDFRAVRDWIALNWEVVIDYWDDKIDIYEVLPRLKKLRP